MLEGIDKVSHYFLLECRGCGGSFKAYDHKLWNCIGVCDECLTAQQEGADDD